MTSLPSVLRRVATRAAALLALACVAATSARAAVWLSQTTFAADALPTLHADAAELAAAQASAGPGGYYKLRAKFIVLYSPGYYQAIDSLNNNGHPLAGSPGAGQYVVAHDLADVLDLLEPDLDAPGAGDLLDEPDRVPAVGAADRKSVV